MLNEKDHALLLADQIACFASYTDIDGHRQVCIKTAAEFIERSFKYRAQQLITTERLINEEIDS